MKKSFRPSARLISTIGEDIIKDMHAAVVELVKMLMMQMLIMYQ